MTENFPKLMTNTKLQKTTSKINNRKSTPRYLVVKLQKN